MGRRRHRGRDAVPHLVWIDQASGVAWPKLSRLSARHRSTRTSIPGCGCSRSSLSPCRARHPGRGREQPHARAQRAGRHRRARQPVDPFARRFVYFFALVPPLVVTSVAVRSTGDPGRRICAADRAVGACGGGRGRRPHLLHHQRIIAATWARFSCCRRPSPLPPSSSCPGPASICGSTSRADEIAISSDNFERRTGTPLKVVAGDTRLASLLALLAPSRPRDLRRRQAGPSGDAQGHRPKRARSWCGSRPTPPARRRPTSRRHFPISCRSAARLRAPGPGRAAAAARRLGHDPREGAAVRRARCCQPGLQHQDSLPTWIDDP